MRLHTMLAVPMAVIMLITLLLVGIPAVGSVGSWRQGQDAIARLQQLRQLLLLQEIVGQERAPTNSALSLHGPMPPELAAAFAASRQATDARLHKLATLPDLTPDIGVLVPVLTARLASARTRVDAVVRRPVEERTPAEIEAAVAGLLSVPPLLFPVVDDTLADIARMDPGAAALLSATHAVADLRLYAGTMVGWFTVALAERRPFTPREVDRVRVEQGQMIEVHRLLLSSIRLAGVVEPTRADVATMERCVFVDAQRLYDQVIATGVSDGRFDLTHAAFVKQYAPALQALVALRDRLLDLTRAHLATEQSARLRQLEVTAATSIGVLLAVIAALVGLHRWVIQPMADLAALVIRLAEGDRSVRLSVRQGSQEITELAAAIEVLRVATIAADAAAAQRQAELQRWTQQLREVLDTIDLLHAGTARITDLLPALLDQLRALAEDGAALAPDLGAATAAIDAGITVLRETSGQLDAALQRMHAVGYGADGRMEELTGAMQEVAAVVATIEASVNLLPQITLSAVRDLSERVGRGSQRASLDRILVQVQDMAATACGLQNALLRATHGVDELARLRA